jgi:hypothetical protein
MDARTARGLARYLFERYFLIEDTDKRPTEEDGPQPAPYVRHGS